MTSTRRSLAELEQQSEFIQRHIGLSEVDRTEMLKMLGYSSVDELIQDIIPERIRRVDRMQLHHSRSEAEVLAELKSIASKNKLYRSFIGQGYHPTYTPGVILRNIMENPAWYTAYTPYQPEISQGRLEALLNFQTMLMELTGMQIANASMLDEATAAAEAMALALRSSQSASRVFFVADTCLPQTIDVIRTRAQPLGIQVRVGSVSEAAVMDCFAALLQYPAVNGDIVDYRELVAVLHAKESLAIVAADLLALTLLEAPGQWGADVVVGNSQRFGVPMGFGGPHAGYLATRDQYKRTMPGRLVGVSIDSQGNQALRLALQTREQHIRREKATSNICTAQVLLAVMAGMYAVYHGPQGLTRIAERVHRLTGILAAGLHKLGFEIINDSFFDTLTIHTGLRTESIHANALNAGMNLRHVDEMHIGVSLNETTGRNDIRLLWHVFAPLGAELPDFDDLIAVTDALPIGLKRKTAFLTHPVFNRYHTETEMLRYLRKLADKDIALDRAMIPLGSCTMKLNATSEMIPVTWPEFADIHPFAPAEQTQGYLEMIHSLEDMLSTITGYAATSVQPNAGSQGEYAGLLVIQAYHQSRGEGHRNICLIPSSAHGTNPASAQMAGMQVVIVACDEQGNVDLQDLVIKAEQHAANLAAIMVTYPSTHGVFEEGIADICNTVHRYGGQVYVDGANMNAMVGLCAPGKFGGDVSHLNLHKTFSIPHGGGGPGVGPIAVAPHLVPFLPGHRYRQNKPEAISAVSAAPFGSAGVLPIAWMYIVMMGDDGLTQASQSAILAANYIAHALSSHYSVLYTGMHDLVAHECILDLRPLKETSGISVEDVAKRLIDYGFHAPTMSFPVAGTLMIEPTESESKAELDRFIAAMIAIRAEIRAVEEGLLDKEDNPLKHAPHTAQVVSADEWPHAYSREKAAYPIASLRQNKYWPPVGRVDNVYGDRNLACACIPAAEYS
jgi:glycine dehydrogenase